MSNLVEDAERKLKDLIASTAFRTSDAPFTLKSGRQSHVYFDLRALLLSPTGLGYATSLVVNMFDRWEDEEDYGVMAVAGILDGGASLATASSIYYAVRHGVDVPIVLVRKEAKGHGAGGGLLLGRENVKDGARVVVVEDVTTTGGSALRGIVALREAGFKVERAVSIVDRQEGGREALKKEGVDLSCLFVKHDFTSKT